MKITKLLFYVVVALVVSLPSFGQKIAIDYSIDYEIIKRGVKDTITIGFDKSGEYLYSSAEIFGKNFQESIFKRKKTNFTNTESHTVFDIKKQFVYFLMSFDQNDFFLKMNIRDFIPPMPNKSPFENISEIFLTKTEEAIEIENKSYDIHDFYFDNEPTKRIKIAYAKDMPFDNTVLIHSLYKMFSGSDDVSKIKTPTINGVILYIAAKGKPLIKAVKINTNPKTLDINYSYKITE